MEPLETWRTNEAITDCIKIRIKENLDELASYRLKFINLNIIL